jgi:hypothetical protein
MSSFDSFISAYHMLSERDEFSYHEIMTHVPLYSHPNPSRVLIDGGGDGGILREVCRHDTVTEMCVVEIDQVVVDVCRCLFGTSTAGCFDDTCVRLVHADAAEFLSCNGSADSPMCNEGYWDVIVGDTSSQWVSNNPLSFAYLAQVTAWLGFSLRSRFPATFTAQESGAVDQILLTDPRHLRQLL